MSANMSIKTYRKQTGQVLPKSSDKSTNSFEQTS